MTKVELKTKNYKEALGYLDNASDILKTKAKKNGHFYEDSKYVGMACETAYRGVLIALDTYLVLKGREINKKNISEKMWMTISAYCLT